MARSLPPFRPVGRIPSLQPKGDTMRYRRFKHLSLLCALALLPAAQLEAQVDPPEPGSYALSFGLLSSGDGAVGIRKMMTPNANAGLNLSFSLNRHELDRANGNDDESHSWGVGLTPDVRLYRNPRGNVIPFLDINAGLSVHGQDGGSWGGSVSTGTGIGVEWFPVSSMSISGKTGLAVFYNWNEAGDSEDAQRTYGLTTRTSSLTVNLYF